MAFSDFHAITCKQQKNLVYYEEREVVTFYLIVFPKKYGNVLTFDIQNLYFFSSGAFRAEIINSSRLLRDIFNNHHSIYSFWIQKKCIIMRYEIITGSPDYMFSTKFEFGKTL